MPSESIDQQRYMYMAEQRKKAGHPRATDPKMSLGKLHEFTYLRKPTAPQRKSYGAGPVQEST